MARSKVISQPVNTQRKPVNTTIWLFLLVLIFVAVSVLVGLQQGQIVSPLLPTPTPTRTLNSYIQQAETYFVAGKLDDPKTRQDAMTTYQKALELDPNNAQVMAELARIMAYSSRTLTTDQLRKARLEEARDLIRRAAELAPDDSDILATKAFVLDWNASSNLIDRNQMEAYLAEAEAAANRAYTLNPDNALALAFYAEVLLDQSKWDQALVYAEQAAQRAPDSMDVHRVYGIVLESVGLYRAAIDEYKLASDLAPNLTFLMLQIGLVYRNMANQSFSEAAAAPLYEAALEYFAKAAQVNEQLEVKDPQPYIAIAKLYAQQGEFFIASRNAEKALAFSPENADTYGQLGMIYVQARNYESALPALQCAVEGCTAQENLIAQDFMSQDVLTQTVPVVPLELTNQTVAYYYIRYGSVLAFLSDAKNGYCEKSIRLMERLRQRFPDDAILLQNADANDENCKNLLSTYGK